MEIKEKIIEALKATNRAGMDNVINYLEKSSFFTDPASCNNHYNFAGGLAEHSYNVMRSALALRKAFIEAEPTLENTLTENKIIVTTLLHDICKTGKYKIEKKNKKNLETGKWEVVDAYVIGDDKFPFGHGDKSVVFLLSLGLKLDIDEMLAIKWHMGLWHVNQCDYVNIKSLDNSLNKYPLVSILQAADSISTHVIENMPDVPETV